MADPISPRTYTTPLSSRSTPGGRAVDDAIRYLNTPPTATTPRTTPPGGDAVDDAIRSLNTPPATTTPPRTTTPGGGAVDDAIRSLNTPPATTTPPRTTTPGGSSVDDAIRSLTPPATTPPPRTNTPGGDAVDGVLDNLDRSISIKHEAMQKLGCTIVNNDGTYSHPGDTGKYYYQADGSIFYAGGTVTNTDGTTRDYGASTHNGTSWNNSRNTMLPFTREIAALDLTPNGDGTFSKIGGRNNRGRYYLQTDGSIWFEGGTINGNPSPAQTYTSGSWDTTRREALGSTRVIAKYKLYQNERGEWINPQYPSMKVYPQNNGNLVYFGQTRNGNPGIWIDDESGNSTLLSNSAGIRRHGCTPNPDGSWSHPTYAQGKYYLQQDGSMIYVGPNTEGRTMMYLIDQNGQFQYIQNSENLADRNITPHQNGSWRLPGYPGQCLVRQNGTLAYVDKDKNEVWERNTDGNWNKLPAGGVMVRLGLVPNSNNNNWNKPGNNNRFVPQSDGTVIEILPDNSRIIHR